MNKPQFLISACLCGVCCRYDGGCFDYPALRQLVKDGRAIPFCPECAGGLPTPRVPCEITHNPDGEQKIISSNGTDCTAAYRSGAKRALEICKANNLNIAILKDGSPSCGVTRIYDGTHTGTRIPGQGITAALLAQNGITLYTEESLPNLK